MNLTNEEKCTYCREYGNLPCEECDKTREMKENQLKATELRIGNTILINNNICNLELPDLNLIANRNGKSTYSPIQLTEDILVKLGFEKNGARLTLGRFTYDSNQRRFEIEGYEYDFNGITFEASYVHQLQNVFFALTGEELTFKN